METSINCSPAAGNGLDTAYIKSNYSSVMAGIQVGYGIPSWEPQATPLNVGTLEYGYALQGKTAGGLLTPIGGVGNFFLTLTINSDQ